MPLKRIKEGTKVAWIGAGKTARAFGYHGETMTGTVTDTEFYGVSVHVLVDIDPTLVEKFGLLGNKVKLDMFDVTIVKGQ